MRIFLKIIAILLIVYASIGILALILNTISNPNHTEFSVFQTLNVGIEGLAFLALGMFILRKQKQKPLKTKYRLRR